MMMMVTKSMNQGNIDCTTAQQDTSIVYVLPVIDIVNDNNLSVISPKV